MERPGVKLVLFSDLHLDAQFAGLGADEQAARGRRQALRDTLERIVHLAQEVRAEALLCGGDLYEHERCSPDTAAFLQATFHQARPLPIYIAPGNHDWLSPDGVYRRTPWSDNVHIFTGQRLAAVTLAAGLTLWGAAHAAPANTGNFLEGFQVDRGGVHLALFHGAEQGWQAPGEEEKAPHAPFWAAQVAAAGLQHAFLGHYHQPRDAEQYTYPGNPAPLTFGEEGERGAVIVTVNPDGSLRRERRPVATVEVHDSALDVTGCRSRQEVRNRLAQVTEGRRGYLRVTLGGELAPEVDLRPADLAGAAPWLSALVVRNGSLHVGYDLASIGTEPTVRGQFVRDVQAAPGLTADQRRRVLLTGLRALDGRPDLEVP
jgi:DNA repair protein SbcD/Mre11